MRSPEGEGNGAGTDEKVVRIAMNDRMLLRGGIVGSAVAALCCATPVLAILLGALGLSAWLVWADNVLLPVLAAFLALTAYALYRRSRRVGGSRQ
jgi:mercuric ion transport protein